MTNAEAIKMLKSKMDGHIDTSYEWAETVRMAIKALEQQTCEDAISRQAVLGLFAQNADAVRPYSKTWEEVKALPSVNPQSKWIPVSERLPEENKTVMASTKFGVYPEVRYSKEYGWEWAYEAGADYWKELKVTVTAWMPLPKKYEPQESEE